MKNLILVLLVLGLLLSLNLTAQIPNKISYQGLLTTSSGTPVQDGDYDLKFDVFDVSSGGTSLWSELHSAVKITKGTFNVILGSVSSLSLTFDEQYYIEVTALAGPGISSPVTFSPRSTLTSAPYSLGLSVPNTLTANVSSAEVLKVINNTDGTALVGQVNGTGSFGAIGVKGIGTSNGPGGAIGGIFSAGGTGESQKTGAYCSGSGNTYWDIYGLQSFAGNQGSGPAFGGNFRAFSLGTGVHYGIYSDAYGTSGSETYGLYGYGQNTSTGAAYGIYAKAENRSSGDARGGYFITDPTNRGTGTRFGIDAVACGGSAYPIETYAVKGWSSNNSSGYSYGGHFTSYYETGSTGRNYGVYSEGFSTGSAPAIGTFGMANNNGSGPAWSGQFWAGTASVGTGERVGVVGSASARGSEPSRGILGYAENPIGSGPVYSGYFYTSSLGPGHHYGIYAKGSGSGSVATYGAQIEAENTSSGSAYGGEFSTSSINRGTGYRAGIRACSYANSSSSTDGVYSVADNSGNGQVFGGYFLAQGTGTGHKYAVYGQASGGGTKYAGYFEGNVAVSGTLSKSAGSFKIDHPLDPENKYLIHSFVESPDMMNIYNGNVVLDSRGEAVVELPKYFEALNKDFRYQLTCIGGYANVYIAEEINNNRFKIAGGTAGLKVSWQVTGVRKDKYAEANRIQVEVDKPMNERGTYLHPDVYGLSEEKGVHYTMHKERAEQLRLRQEEEIKHRADQQKFEQDIKNQIQREEEHRKARLEEQKKKLGIQ